MLLHERVPRTAAGGPGGEARSRMPNTDVIAVDQDSQGKQGTAVSSAGGPPAGNVNGTGLELWTGNGGARQQRSLG
ncbi:hypothetical protein [Streptomyces sp. NPDC056844]|uniref:hypothetical protein n=1 Tax=unclassified Streptomyces TaxID=2593676 RepID=UPI003690668A